MYSCLESLVFIDFLRFFVLFFIVLPFSFSTHVTKKSKKGFKQSFVL
jgi:hypothetical protein